jgi:hypothetical protein
MTSKALKRNRPRASSAKEYDVESGRNVFQEMPLEILEMIFGKVHIIDLPNLLQVSRELNVRSGEKLQ